MGAEQVQVVSASASFRGLCAVATIDYIYGTFDVFIDGLIKDIGETDKAT